MEIADFLVADRVLLDVRARDKCQLIDELARNFGRLVPTLNPDAVAAALVAREQLGSTGVGAGVALPHAPVANLDVYLGLFARLARPIDFEAIDGEPVQLVFVLLMPSDGTTSHVAALAAIFRRFRETTIPMSLRRARTRAAAYSFLTNN